MGRDIKKNLDYFPFVCHVNDKLKLVIATFGVKGLGVFVGLLQKIYGQEGYYLEVNDDVLLVFALDYNVSASCVSECLNLCIKIGLFDKSMYDKYSILTSEAIQARYLEAVYYRKVKKIDERYSLLKCAQNEPKKINDTRKVINDTRNGVNDIENTQIKRKEKKLNNIGQKEELFDQFWDLYPKKVSKKEAQKAFMKIKMNDEVFNRIITSLKVAKKSEQWQNVKYIPHASTWLNQERYNDEIEKEVKSNELPDL